MARDRLGSVAGQAGNSGDGLAEVGEPELLTSSEVSFDAPFVRVDDLPPPPAVRFDGVSKWFGSFCVLDNIDLTVDQGETLAIIGPSGAGKSTLIRCINGLERYDAGELSILGDVHHQTRADLARLRRQTGMVFQDFNLFPDYSVLRNVTLPQRLVLGRSPDEAEAIAIERLTEVCLLYTSPSPRDS